MACYRPLRAYRGTGKTEKGKAVITFKRQRPSDDLIKLPCGRCIGCRLDRSRSWALRCHHEAQSHGDSSFVTLTYEEEPDYGSLNYNDYQLFLKRLRKKREPQKIRFYMCGEYGSVYDANNIKVDGELGRPHYHAILFGCDFADREYFKQSESGHKIYVSQELENLWGHGHAAVQDFSSDAAAYVARYVMKKVNGDRAENHYQRVSTVTGEIYQVRSEFSQMSQGIGKDWIKRYYSDLYPKDFVTMGGIRHRPPKYYDVKFEEMDSEQFETIKEARRENVKEESDERLAVMEKCREAKIEKLLER